MNIISLEHISKSFIGGKVLDDVSLFVPEGARIGVIGVNGTGKSTLLKIMAGVLTPDGGSVTLSGGAQLSYLPQQPEFPEGLTVLDAVFYHITNRSDEKEYEAKAILGKLGVSDFGALVNHLSGGQRKRIAIAASLIRESDLLLLDEPTNHIDVEMVSYLEEQLMRRKGALIMVTHDRYFLERVCNRMIEVDGGKLYEYEANYSKYLEMKAEREVAEAAARRKLMALYRNELAWISRGARARSTKQKFRVNRFDDLKEAVAPVAEQGSITITTGHTRLGKKLIELNHVSKGFGGRTLINDFSYTLTRDDRIGIIGQNGAGKSTLMNLIAGALTPDSGEVTFGETVNIDYLKQEVPVYPPDKRVIDAVKDISSAIQTSEGTLSASQLCEKFLIDGTMQYTQCARLSGGEKRRLYLMQVLMGAPNVLLLDEPTNDIDIQTLTILEDYLSSFPGPVIAVSHDRYFLDKFARRIFAPDGQGNITDSVGGYTDYRELMNAQKAEKPAETETAKPASRHAGRKKLRFSFKEEKEFSTIDADIASLEEKIKDLENQAALFASDYVKLTELAQEKEKAEQALEEKTERWFYLNDLHERIERGEYEDEDNE